MSPSSINAGVLTGLFFHKSYTYSHSSYEFCVRSVSFKEQHLYIYLKKSFFFFKEANKLHLVFLFPSLSLGKEVMSF